jgi:2-amino-4-hydroxy-6-hydroxymethyldihydropteridine diphosphokinase
MNRAYLLMGGNMGDRLLQLKLAKEQVSSVIGKVVKASSIYETAAWGITDQPSFLNQVVLVETNLDPRALITTILQIEQLLGRERQEKMGPRTIDIDILLYNNVVVNETDLVIPHPRMASRKFALLPLAEIAGDVLHPVEQVDMKQLLEQCTDTLAVTVFQGHVQPGT